jgi:hypothetical protein
MFAVCNVTHQVDSASLLNCHLRHDRKPAKGRRRWCLVFADLLGLNHLLDAEEARRVLFCTFLVTHNSRKHRSFSFARTCKNPTIMLQRRSRSYLAFTAATVAAVSSLECSSAYIQPQRLSQRRDTQQQKGRQATMGVSRQRNEEMPYKPLHMASSQDEDDVRFSSSIRRDQ